MIQRSALLVVLIAVALVVTAVIATPGTDEQAPALLAPYVDYAKHLAREKAGPLGLLGVRLVAAGCAPGGNDGAMMFETHFALARSFALVAFPPPSELTQPGAVTTIAGFSESEFAAEGDASWLSIPCS